MSTLRPALGQREGRVPSSGGGPGLTSQHPQELSYSDYTVDNKVVGTRAGSTWLGTGLFFRSTVGGTYPDRNHAAGWHRGMVGPGEAVRSGDLSLIRLGSGCR